MNLLTTSFTYESVFFSKMVPMGIKVNNDIGHHFQTQKGMGQGDLLLPMHFNILVDVLSILIARAKQDGQVEGLVPHLVDLGVLILQWMI
jgi:hypothetical protein